MRFFDIFQGFPSRTFRNLQPCAESGASNLYAFMTSTLGKIFGDDISPDDDCGSSWQKFPKNGMGQGLEVFKRS
jgi:hypothetical protein